MESRKVVLMNLFIGAAMETQREQIYGHGAGVGEEGEGGVYGKSNMETYTLPYVK